MLHNKTKAMILAQRAKKIATLTPEITSNFKSILGDKGSIILT